MGCTSVKHYLFCNSMMMNEPNAIQFNFNFPFKILNWNVRGMGDSNKCDVIKDSVLNANCDIICFQETKWCEHSIFCVRQVCPNKFRHYITLDAIGSKGGILLAWSDAFTTLESIINNYTATIIIKRGDFKFMLTGVYGPQRDVDKMIFLNEIR